MTTPTEPTTTPAPIRLARCRNYFGLAFTLAVVALVADQATKYGMFRELYRGEGTVRGEREVVPGWFRFTAEFNPQIPFDDGFLGRLQVANGPVMPRVNYGALFGLGGEHTSTANLAFAAVSGLAALGILIWLTRRGTRADGWLSAALGLILGGTVGNLYDRVVFHGVRDFLYFYKIDWPVFNVADCCLVVGAGMLLVHAFLIPTPPKPTEEAIPGRPA
jgi:signal peptidase II